MVSDGAMDLDRPAVPSVLAVGAVHAALTEAGLRGRTDLLADAADLLDVHAMAMVLAAGATVAHPRLAIELAAELAGGRGAEDRSAAETIGRLLDAFEAGLRKTLARMGISAVGSYVGAEPVRHDRARARGRRALLPGGRGLARSTHLRRPRGADPASGRTRPRRWPRPGPTAKLADPGLARFRADGEHHGYAPAVVRVIQAIANGDDPACPGLVDRPAPAVVRDGLRVRRPRGVPATDLARGRVGPVDRRGASLRAR